MTAFESRSSLITKTKMVPKPEGFSTKLPSTRKDSIPVKSVNKTKRTMMRMRRVVKVDLAKGLAFVVLIKVPLPESLW